MADSPQRPIPILEYRRNAEAYPEDLAAVEAAAVEAALDRQEPMGKIRLHFRTSSDAVRYVTRSMAGRYAESKLGATCIDCQTEPAALTVEVLWEVRMNEPTRRRSAPAFGSFTAFHPICTSCAVQWEQKVSRSWVTHLAPLAVVLLCMLFVLLYGLPLVLLTVGIAIVCKLVLDRTWRQSLPKYLRRGMPQGVVFDSVVSFRNRHHSRPDTPAA